MSAKHISTYLPDAMVAERHGVRGNQVPEPIYPRHTYGRMRKYRGPANIFNVSSEDGSHGIRPARGAPLALAPRQTIRIASSPPTLEGAAAFPRSFRHECDLQ
jgi:hypothetical protein